MSLRRSSDESISFSSTWQLLGPFQTGTREATWGADPLEYHGGFRSLSYDTSASYPSSLATTGAVGWSTCKSDIPHISSKYTAAKLLVKFENTDWKFLQSVYGWAALQYQAWARDVITVHGEVAQTVTLYTDQVLEFWIDDDPYFGGDFYAFRRAPLVVRLDPGDHRLDVRIIRDARAMGSIGEPTVNIQLEAQISEGGLNIVENSMILPDVVEGKLVSSDLSALRLASGQSRPLTFDAAVSEISVTEISLKITYRVARISLELRTHICDFSLRTKKRNEPHKITYVHPGEIVSYAILRPPSEKALRYLNPSHCLPIVVALHGAGVDTDSSEVRHMLDDAPDLRAWVVIPSGVTEWCGDDWHRWGFADVKAAVAAIPEWIKTLDWKGPTLNAQQWLVIGHSNGGQGTWYALTHAPDTIIGAAPISGYSSIQDPSISAIIQRSLLDFRHESLLENSYGIPVHQEHGSVDDNVPTSHSRRLRLLLSQIGCPSTYVELPGKNHWFEGIMTTRTLIEFYNHVLDSPSKQDFPRSGFTMVIANPGTMGSMHGIIVDQLISPDQPGRIRLTHDNDTYTRSLSTSNIHRLHFAVDAPDRYGWLHSRLSIDGTDVEEHEDIQASQWLTRSPDGSWKVSSNDQWLKDQRHGQQFGSLDAILSARGRFVITNTTGTSVLAVQISRNLLQYFGADAEILAPHQPSKPDEKMRITIFIGNTDQLQSGGSRFSSISVEKDRGLLLRDAHGRTFVYTLEDGLGAIFLRPSAGGALELVIWGYDLSGLQHAARLIPMLTGVGQPDFVVVRRDCAWKGAAGALALGYFDNSWNISVRSVLS
ncbi:MAG: hypothetical protein Q9220_003026 [cf. Caloplaca sp. 1 TL-2023]